jgi:F0F1-type ATP synthase membrane subunit b/b'
MKLDETFILALSFLLFCILVAKPLYSNIVLFLNDKIKIIIEKITLANKSKEAAFQELKKFKKLFLNTKKENIDRIKEFKIITQSSNEKAYNNLLLTLERNYKDNLNIVESERNQKALGIYDNLVTNSSNILQKYILKNRSELPSDVMIAKSLLKNIKL